ncbi:MAG: hypothetical protein ACKV22_24505, partial [Bryobacteraceae bacterium]
MTAIHIQAWHAADWERFLARAISSLWALFWLWFGLASGIAEGMTPGGILVHTAVPGLIFALLTAFAWRKERAGSYVFLFAGLFTYGAYWNMMGHRGVGYFLE